MDISKRQSFGQVAATALLLCTSCMFAHSLPTPASFSGRGGGGTISTEWGGADERVALRMGSTAAGIKVEFFLDLACPISAAAWPELKKIVDDNTSRVNFAFRIHPMPRHQYAFEAAKAMQVVRYHAFNGGGGDIVEVTSFMNHVFDGQALILNEAAENLTRLDVRQILGEWAVSSGSMTFEDFESAIVDLKFEKWATQEFESACACGVLKTPTAVINGVTLELYDEGKEGLEELRHILDQQTKSSMITTTDEDDSLLWMGPLSLREESPKLSGGGDEALSIDRVVNLLAQESANNNAVAVY